MTNPAERLLAALTVVALLAVFATIAAAVYHRSAERRARALDPAPYVPVLLITEDDRVVTDAGVVTVTGRAPLTGDGYLTVTCEDGTGRAYRHDWPVDSTVRVLRPAGGPAPHRRPATLRAA